MRRKDYVLKMPALIVISDIEDLAIFTSHRLAVERLDTDVLTKGVVIAGLLEFLFFGRKLLNDLIRSNTLRRIGGELAFLTKTSRCEAQSGGHYRQSKACISHKLD